MSWESLLSENVEVVAPWTGGTEIRHGNRRFSLKKRPTQPGWFVFRTDGTTTAHLVREASYEEQLAALEIRPKVTGYLVGDRLVPDGVSRPANVRTALDLVAGCQPALLVEDGLARFTRIVCRRWEDGRLFYQGEDFPLGSEYEVQLRYENRETDLDGVKGVVPSLYIAFELETWHRSELEKQRAEAERLAKEEEAKRQLEERRVALANSLETGAGRRAMAELDFETAAKAALNVTGAKLLDWRKGRQTHEAVVRFQLEGQRFECVCDKRSLRIIESGICLVNHATGEAGDTKFTLESLPPVILEAKRKHKLVVFRDPDPYR